jgi:hypothetical protein
LSHFSQDRAEMREILKTTTSNFWVDGKNVSVELFLSYQALEKRHSVPTGCPFNATIRTLNKPNSDAANDNEISLRDAS